jgi:hypothetical protein
MRSREFTTTVNVNELRTTKKVREPKVGDTTPHDYNPGWERLNYIKERAHTMGTRMVSMQQLFMPRPSVNALTNRDKRLKNLTNPYAWDKEDPSKLKPEYDRWEDGLPRVVTTGTNTTATEAAPILTPSKAVISPPGHNKPLGATLWTSSARRLDNNTYTSDWVRWVSENQPDWMSPVGYLYKVNAGLILPMDSDHNAEDIKEAFQNLERAKPTDYDNHYNRLGKDFPWDAISKHFDAVHHYPRGGGAKDFLYGWDCESTAWFNTDILTLIGEVKINQNGLSPYGSDDFD